MGCFCANRIQNQVISKKENSINYITKKTKFDSAIAINSGIFVNQKNYDEFLKEYQIIDFIGKGYKFDNYNKSSLNSK
jgi:exosome complex RNA-binding protein Rrp4